MGDQVKKISFGFSKLAKKTTIVSSQLNKNNQEEEVSKVELIDCLEGKSIKLKDPVKLDQGPLIIPLKRKNTDNNSSQQENTQNTESLGLSIKNESTHFINSFSALVTEENGKLDKKDNVDETGSQTKNETLDEIAEREILEELKQKNTEDDEKRVFSVPLTTNAPSGEKESTLEDYDNIPVNAFGMAMLRGMGWAPGKGIGKTEKLVTPTLPTLRPKGMGLGADKVIKSAEKKNSSEDLKMVKGSYVRILAGPEKDTYGQIEGFDDESGRLIIKLALKNISVSLNEFMVQLVDTNEFKKNSKVLNVSKYERYKKEEVKNKVTEKLNKSENPVERSYNNKARAARKERSSSCESKEENRKGKIVDTSPELHTSRGTDYGRNKSSRSPNDKRKGSSRSQSRSNKYESIKPETSSKYSDKNSTGRNKKNRAYSTDSSDSSSNHRTANKSKIKFLKSKSPLRDKSISRRRSMSNSSTSSDSFKNYSRKKKDTYKKKSSSNKYRSRSRSRSPRKHKHKKSKKSRH